MIHNITFINQNSHVPSVVMSDHVAREVVSKEVQKVIEEDKELKVKEIRPIEKNPSEGSEIEPETACLQSFGALCPYGQGDGLPFA